MEYYNCFNKIFKMQYFNFVFFFISLTNLDSINNHQNLVVTEEGEINQVNFSYNSIALLKDRFPQFAGNGIIICQKEHNADPLDVDLFNKILPSGKASFQSSLHATSVASIILGAGNSMPQNKGIASQGKIIPVAFSSFFPENDKFYIENKISIINHSYGSEIDNRYSPEAYEYDGLVNRIPYIVNVFSSGNNGLLASPNGIYKGLSSFANISGNYKMSKNTISVGSFSESDTMVQSSSNGPTFDGRIKPEIVTYSNGGTSFSAATITGVVATLQEAFKNYNNLLPACSLIKALLIGTSDDISTEGPDFKSGYGSLNAYEAMTALQNKTYFEGRINHLDIKEFKIDIPPNVKRVKFTLVWTDPAGRIGNPKALVNDLDFEIGNTYSMWLPWVLSAYPNIDSLKKAAVRKIDSINNVEMISFDNPLSGSYTVKVKGSNISNNNQLFHIVYQFVYDNFLAWEYPVSNCYLQANEYNTLRWKNTLIDERAKLYYSRDNGISWDLITDDLIPKKGQFTWQTPNVYGSTMLKISTKNQDYLSNSFGVVNPLSLNIEQNCEDSLKLNWNPASSNQPVKYIVQKLDKITEEWKEISNTAKTEVTVKDIKTDDWLSVTPVITSNWAGLRSNAVSPSQSSDNCYYNSFEVYSTDKNTIELNIQLSQTVNVVKIIFEKSINGAFQTISEQEIITDQIAYFTQDNKFSLGQNSYRVIVVFANGKKITTFINTLFIFNDSDDIVVYPNPISPNQDLNINFKYFGEYLVDIFTLDGKNVFRQAFNRLENKIALINLQSGSYLIKIKNSEKNLEVTKKLILR
ncbi:S8 family serine peptidase [Lacihabitans soyangensis]|uniref:T9SS C-terminal target domain-containing protein n=1 Tax=Lacihabitans soyangensis TaxID=869394 RepID=A0AAE3H4D5_9BACT|nr:S8 family serine peptidase [Lacihabitans soyangensis]MCP9763711.1 T9SS C-terminal target domain-containing protein [Lacihabitans soyangensis]